jgi:hypothetical protein
MGTMTDTAEYPRQSTSSTEFELTIRDDATQAERQNAESSVAALLARSRAAVAQLRAAEADLAELTDSLDEPFVRLVKGDPLAGKALKELTTRELLQSDVTDELRPDSPYLAQGPSGPAREGVPSVRSLGFVPPYDFSWSWHDGNGNPPFSRVLDRPRGDVGLDARSGSVPGGASGFVNAHAGFGVFLRSDSMGQRFPHAVLNPGRFSYAMRSVGIGGNATSEGGFEITVFEDGRLLAAADRKLWRRRVSGNESASDGQGPQVITGPELEFTIHPGREYTFNAGIWVFSDRSSGVGAAAVQSLLQGTVTRMWVFG